MILTTQIRKSAVAAIRWLSVVRAKGKRVAVLADMLELGESSKREHQRVGKEIARTNVDCLFTFGKLAKGIADAASLPTAERKTKRKLKTESFDNKEKLSEKVLQIISPGDAVLVKGSRGMKMEEVVNALTRNLQNKGYC